MQKSCVRLHAKFWQSGKCIAKRLHKDIQIIQLLHVLINTDWSLHRIAVTHRDFHRSDSFHSLIGRRVFGNRDLLLLLFWFASLFKYIDKILQGDQIDTGGLAVFHRISLQLCSLRIQQSLCILRKAIVQHLQNFQLSQNADSTSE